MLFINPLLLITLLHIKVMTELPFFAYLTHFLSINIDNLLITELFNDMSAIFCPYIMSK